MRFDEAEVALCKASVIRPELTEVRRMLDDARFSLDLSDFDDKRSVEQSAVGDLRALFCRFKFVPNSPLGQRAHEQFIMTNPFRQSRLGRVADYYLDEAFAEAVPFRGRRFRRLAEAIQPDFIALSSYDVFNVTHPSFQLLQEIRRIHQIPLVWIWHDTCGDSLLSRIASSDVSEILDQVDLHVLADSSSCIQKLPQVKFLRLLPPVDEDLFFPSSGALDIPISFVGSTSGYRSIRQGYLDYLKDGGVPLVSGSGGQVDAPLSWDTYAETLRRSRISLNFSHSVGGEHQLKARVLEILFSGSLLIENDNQETRSFFVPGVDYVCFTTREDLFDKVQ